VPMTVHTRGGWHNIAAQDSPCSAYGMHLPEKQYVPEEHSESNVQPPGATQKGHDGQPPIIGACRTAGNEQVGIMGQFSGAHQFCRASPPFREVSHFDPVS